MDPLEKNLAHRLAYEFILTSMEEDLDMKDLEFIDQDQPHETIDKLIKHNRNERIHKSCVVTKKENLRNMKKNT